MTSCQNFIMQERDDPGQNDGAGELTELDTILQNIELENKPDTQLSEKEQQQIAALERNIAEKEAKIQRIQEELKHSDEDTKTLHRQFRQNKDNVESLRKDAEVLTSHGDTMETKLIHCQTKYENIREKRATQLDHYQATWSNYHAKYESTQLAQKWKVRREKVEVGLQVLVDQAECVKDLTSALEELGQKLASVTTEEDAWKAWIIELAKTKVSTAALPREADEVTARIKESELGLEKALEKKKEAEELQKRASQLAQEKIAVSQSVAVTAGRDHPTQSQPKEMTVLRHTPAPVSMAPVLQRPVPQLFMPQTPRPGIQRSETAPPPLGFLQIPQRQKTSVPQVAVPQSPSIRRNTPILSNSITPQSFQPPPVGIIQGATPASPTEKQTSPPPLPESSEPMYGRMEVPMETDVPYEQLPLSSQSSGPPGTPKTPTGDQDIDNGLSASQVREKILDLSKSPGFSFACRPMYQSEEVAYPVPSSEADQASTSNSFFNFFGQMGQTSPSQSAVNMFASPVHSDGPDGNIMSMFGGSSQEDPSVPQEAGSGFSFNFSSSSGNEPEKSSFSLF